jgi:hypothetical protein
MSFPKGRTRVIFKLWGVYISSSGFLYGISKEYAVSDFIVESLPFLDFFHEIILCLGMNDTGFRKDEVQQ